MHDETDKKRQALPPFSLKHFPDWLRHRFSDTQRHFILWILAGLACGLAGVGFHEAIATLWEFVVHTAASVGGGTKGYAVLAVAPALGGLVCGLIMDTIDPTAAGSGIPQTKVAYFRSFGVMKFRHAVWRFIAGSIGVGSGIALGPEGPTVHICATIASKIGQIFGLAKSRIQAMVPVGMGAGIAAAFNTPLAAMFYVFEELLDGFSSKALFGILVSVVIAAIVERSMLGENATFILSLPAFETSWWMLLCIPVGLACAVFGHLFVKALLYFRVRIRDTIKWPRTLQLAVSGLLVGLIGVFVLAITNHSGVFSIGYNDLSLALNGRMLALGILIPLFIGKFAVIVIAYASGNSGGLFAPALFLGGLLGAIVGVLGQMLFGYAPEVVGALALIGMGCFFAAVIRCPLTSFMIIFELTRNYTIMLPLMIGNILAYILATKWQPIALNDSLLLQDKITLKRMPAYQGEQDWRNLPVKTIMTFEVVTVEAELTAAQSLDVISKGGLKHHAYPVLTKDERLIGMITHHELEERRAKKDEAPIADHLPTHPLVTISPDTSIREVARILVTEDVLQAPVASPTERNKLLGIVTLHDIARQQNAISESLGR